MFSSRPSYWRIRAYMSCSLPWVGPGRRSQATGPLQLPWGAMMVGPRPIAHLRRAGAEPSYGYTALEMALHAVLQIVILITNRNPRATLLEPVQPRRAFRSCPYRLGIAGRPHMATGARRFSARRRWKLMSAPPWSTGRERHDRH